MKSVSDAYKSSMKARLRNNSYVKIAFYNVDPAAALDGSWESNGAVSYSEVETLDYEYDYSETYATLELNRWALNGEEVILPASGAKPDGFISSFISGADGTFTSPATLTREFSVARVIPGLTLTFDTRCGEWPVTVTADFYLNGSVIKSATVAVTSETAEIDTQVDACDKIVITFGDTLPYRRPRLEEVLYGLVKRFTNRDLVSTKQSHDVDPLTRRLPKETMQFVVLDYKHDYDPDNPSGIYKYIDTHSPVSIRFGYTLPSGKVEWLKADRYVLNGKPKVVRNQATFTGTGLIGSLSDTFYKSKLGSKNLYDMAEEILLDANLTLTSQGTHPWVIDESLKQMITTAALPIDTHMNCLQLIAHAACCRLFTDDDNVIHIAPFRIDDVQENAKTDFELDFNTISVDGQEISKIDKLKAVSVAKYSYTAANDASKLFEETTAETELHVEFSGLAQDISISVSGGTLVSSNIYAGAADLVLSSGTKTVVITGKTLTENSVVVSYPVSSEGEIDKEENPLITNDALCTALAAQVKQYLQLRNTYRASYRGNPEVEVGDVIDLQTLYTEKMNALVLVDELSFSGTLSGKLTVKGLL